MNWAGLAHGQPAQLTPLYATVDLRVSRRRYLVSCSLGVLVDTLTGLVLAVDGFVAIVEPRRRGREIMQGRFCIWYIFCCIRLCSSQVFRSQSCQRLGSSGFSVTVD